MTGLDAAIEIGPNTRIRTEVAVSTVNAGSIDKSGAAYLAELTRQSGDLEGKVYLREQDEDFGLGQQNGSETGTRKYGLDAAYRITENLTAGGQLYHHDFLTTGAGRDLAEAGLQYRTTQYSLNGGVRIVGDELGSGTTQSSNQVTAGGSWWTRDNRLMLRLNHDQSIGSDDSAEFPTRTVAGSDYKISQAVTLSAEQEFTQGEHEDTNSTRLGMKATPWQGGQASTSIRRQINENGEHTFANLGLTQTWKINGEWSADAGWNTARLSSTTEALHST